MRRFLQLKIAVLMLAIMVVGCNTGQRNIVSVLSATPDKINWTQAAVNEPAGKKNIVITNTSDKEITDISYYLANAQTSIFLVGDNCPATLSAKATCIISVDFKPDQKGQSYSDKYVFEYVSAEGKATASISLVGNTLLSSGEPTSITELMIINAKGSYNQWSYKDTISSPIGVKLSTEVFISFKWIGTKSSAQIKVIEQSVTDEFTFRNGCTSTLTMNSDCNIYFTFTPATEAETKAVYKIRVLKDNSLIPEDITLEVNAKGTLPEKSSDIVIESSDANEAGVVVFAETEVGKVSDDYKTVTIRNNSEKTLYNRVIGTLGSFNINLNTCTGVLKAKGAEGDSCTVKMQYSPNRIGEEQAYIKVIAGGKLSYIKLSGTGRDASNILGSLILSTESLVFPDTEDGFISATKRITITAPNSKTDNSSVSFKLSDSKYIQTFRYTTTCSPTTPLDKNEKCYLDMTYAPNTVAGIDPNIKNLELIVKIKNSTKSEEKSIAISGTMLATKEGNLETPIPDVTVSTKRYAFPNTATGLSSPALLIKVKNGGNKNIEGFSSGATDLINFPLVKDLTTCGSVIPAKSECNIAYQFVARSTALQTAYISIWADGIESDNQIIQISGRGTLFNKYLSFGYVDAAASEQKILSMAYVNDTSILQKIASVELEAFTTDWAWSDKIDSFMPSAFTKTVLTDDSNPFSIVSNDCNRELASQQSCIINVRFDTTKTSGKMSDNNTYRAYIKLKDSTGKTLESEDINSNRNNIVGQFHATASTLPDTIMFFPADNMNYENPYQPYTYIGNTTVAFGEKIFAIGGSSDKIESGDDLDLKVYDASRNMWKKLNPDGKSPLKYYADYLTLSGLPSAFVNSKLYMFSGGLSGGIGSDGKPLKNLRTQDLFVYDPNDTKVSPDGSWRKLDYTYLEATKAQPRPLPRHSTSGAALRGHIFSFGGANGNNESLLSEFLVIDLRDETKTTMTNLEEKSPTAERPYPKARTAAAITAYNDKIYMHGGNIAAVTLSDLWEYTPIFDEDGKITRDGTWKCLYQGDNSTEEWMDKVRPAGRMQHKLLPVGDKLYITGSGFEWKNYKLSPVAKNKKPYFEVLPNKINDTTSVLPFRVFEPFKINDQTDFQKLGREITDKLSGHTTIAVEGVLWFHNVNIMGLFIEKK